MSDDERRSILKDQRLINLLKRIMERGGKLEPEKDTEHGFKYSWIENGSSRDDEQKVREVLEKAADAKILERKFVNMVLRCPSCESANIATTYHCPLCGSPRISKNLLIEHTTCGYIMRVSELNKSSEAICPKCRMPITEGSYRVIERVYECKDCGKRADFLKINHECRSCGKIFTFDEALYDEFYSYVISSKNVAEIDAEALFQSTLKHLMSDLGVEVVIPSSIKGKSGVEHEYSAVIQNSRGKKLFVIDFLNSQKPIDETKVIAEYAKALDSQALDSLYVIVFPSMTDEARKIAKLYKLNVFEGDIEESIKTLKEVIKKKIKR